MMVKDLRGLDSQRLLSPRLRSAWGNCSLLFQARAYFLKYESLAALIGLFNTRAEHVPIPPAGIAVYLNTLS